MKPTAEDVWATIIRLIEQRNGVKITYRLVPMDDTEETEGTENHE